MDKELNKNEKVDFEMRPLFKQTNKEGNPQKTIDAEKTDEQKEIDAVAFLRGATWAVGIIIAFVLVIMMINEFKESSPDTKDWLPLLAFLVLDIVGMIVNLSIIRIASGIARNLHEINNKLK